MYKLVKKVLRIAGDLKPRILLGFVFGFLEALFKKRYWLYGRVASPDTWALENQMNYLRSFAEKHQLNVVGESQDEASGLTFDRPGLNDFLEAVRQGRADALLTKDLTRLGRDVMQTASWIADLNTSGVGVFSVTDLTLRGL